MKQFRVICAAIMLLTVMLNSLPNSVLDLFHHHHHTTHDPYTGNEVRFEEEHVHCFIPDLFFEVHEIPAEVRVQAVVAYAFVFKTPVQTFYSHHTFYTSGRAPPFTSMC